MKKILISVMIALSTLSFAAETNHKMTKEEMQNAIINEMIVSSIQNYQLFGSQMKYLNKLEIIATDKSNRVAKTYFQGNTMNVYSNDIHQRFVYENGLDKVKFELFQKNKKVLELHYSIDKKTGKIDIKDVKNY